MIKIGITGSLASGKTTASRILAKKHGPLFSADKAVKEIYQNKNFRSLIVKKFKIKNQDRIKKSLRKLILKNKENIKRLVSELKLNSQVMFFKEITDDLKNALIAKSNIFVMPSVIYKSSVEGFGIAYVEAAQYGIPSLGGKDGGASDAIDHNRTGLICDGNDLDDILSLIHI